MPKKQGYTPRPHNINEVGSTTTTFFDAVRGVQSRTHQSSAHPTRQHARQRPIQSRNRHNNSVIIPEQKKSTSILLGTAKAGFWVTKNVLKGTLGSVERAKRTLVVGTLGSLAFLMFRSDPSAENVAKTHDSITVSAPVAAGNETINTHGKTPIEAYLELSPVVQKMLSDTGYVPATETPDAQPYINKVRESGKISGYFSEPISPLQLLALSYAGGFRGDDLKHIGRIELRESGGAPITIGDNGFRGAERISVGLYQMTCGADGIECSGINDPNANIDPLLSAFNAKALSEQAEQYWGYSMRFKPWHKSGDQNLSQFENVINNAYNELEAMTGVDLSAS